MSVSQSIRSQLGLVFLVAFLLLAAWLIFWMTGEDDGTDPIPSGEARAPQSLVLVTVDGLRRDALSALGGPRRTPGLDRLAREGVLFLQAATAINETVPALGAISTALYPIDLDLHWDGQALCSGATTLAEHLATQGFTCAAFLGTDVVTEDEDHGLRQGFTTFRVSTGPEGSAQELVERALRWLEGPSKPTFLWIHLSDPTTPYAAEAKDPEGDILFPVRPSWRESDRLRFLRGRIDHDEIVELYRDRVADVDGAVSRLVGGLSEQGRLESTLVTLTGTYGESLGEHEIYFDHYGLYDPVVMVPWILRGGVPAGVQVKSLVKTIDLVPTVCALLEVPRLSVPTPAQATPRAEDVSPLWAPEGDHAARTRIALIEQAGSLAGAGRTNHNKFIISLQPTTEYPHLQWTPNTIWAYDIEGDPEELTDRSGEFPTLIDDFAQQFGVLVAHRHDPCPE